MTVLFHFVCSAPECKTHVQVSILCHDDHKYDLDKIGEGVGFWRREESNTIVVNRWYCAEHAP